MDNARQGVKGSNRQQRTRADLLHAAVRLMRAGGRPTIAEVGDAAAISRRTAYRYFPSQERLLTEAALELLRPSVELAYESIGKDPEARISAVVRTMQYEAIANEDLLRTMIRLTIERSGERSDKRIAPVRGKRRIDWIEGALQPARGQLTQREFGRLVSAVSLCVGAEALIVLRDVRGLDPESAVDVSSWTARALVRAALLESAKNAAHRGKSGMTKH